MHRILAWDTSGRVGVLAAFELQAEAKLLHAELLQIDQRQHSEGLFVGIESALGVLSWTWSQVDAIGVGVGPGSFTGVRVGLTAARTFGQMLGIPLVPVSSLALWTRGGQPQVVCVDACMGEVYLREVTREGIRESVRRVSGLPGDLDLPSVGVWLSSPRHAPLCPAGWTWQELEDPTSVQSLPHALAREVGAAFQGGAARGALELHPSYLRAPDAQLKLQAKLAAIR